MVVFPNAKINIGLYITGKRPDGYHNLESVFFPVPWQDALELIPWYPETDALIDYRHSGLSVPGQEKDNLCIKAYHMVRSLRPLLPAIRLHLHKNIPMGAGLGGGSSDAAHMLILLNKRFKLELDSDSLHSLALSLGSDCPFFIQNTPCLATGRGEKLEPINLDLEAYRIWLVNPGIHIPTAWAFSQIKPKPTENPLSDSIREPVSAWRHLISNDFEKPVMDAYPEIGVLKNTLYDAGAEYVSMTGSGSTVYALFPKSLHPNPILPPHYTSFQS